MKRIVKIHDRTSGYVNATVKFDDGEEMVETFSIEDFDIQKAKEDIIELLIDELPSTLEYIESRLRTIEERAWTKGSESGYEQGYACGAGDNAGM